MINEKYNLWCQKATTDPDLVKELNDIKAMLDVVKNN